MTKKLEELLNLPESQEIIQEDAKPKRKQRKTKEELNDTLRKVADFDKITEALPKVKGLGDAADAELDEVAQRSMDAYDDLMDLGMNVESRYAGRVFETASNMLKNAIDAKSQKLDKKLKMVELQLKKQNLDQKQGDNAETIDAEGYVVMDRNAILEKILNKDQDK